MGKQQNKAKAESVQEPPVPETAKPKLAYWIAVILLLTLIAYLPIFSSEKEFTNWDDISYVTEQPLVKDLNAETVNKMFAPGSEVALNYHPLTMLSLALDYQRGYDTDTLSIAPFAFTNIILHLLNTALVFIFIYKLGRKRIWVAAITAVLFGIHPMHVESVAWISERKDVLYCFFFLLSCISYYEYVHRKRNLMLAASFVFFIASCLSKAMAVPLPLVLLLIDYLEKRKITAKVILEKLPYLAVSVWIGLNALKIQAPAMGDGEVFTFGERLMFAAYGFSTYLFKLFLPFKLSAFYPYPAGEVSAIFYLMPIIALAIVAIPIIIFIKRHPVRAREITWGLGFYILTIALVLQFISVGSAIIADRYTYLSYIGPLFIISLFANDFIDHPKYRNIALGIVGVFIAMLLFLTNSRTKIWESSKTLWEDVIAKYPNQYEENSKMHLGGGIKTAYKNMGDYYAGLKMYDSAFVYYNVLVMAGTNDAEVYSNVGNIYAIRKDMPNALKAFSLSIFYDSANSETYLKRGIMYAQNKMHAEAIADMNKVISLQPQNEEAYLFRSRSLLGLQNFDEAASLSAEALKKFPNNADLWFCKGIANISLSQYETGIADLQQAIKIKPGSGLYYYNIASAYDKMGQKQQALQYAKQAQQYGFPVSPDFIKKLEN